MNTKTRGSYRAAIELIKQMQREYSSWEIDPRVIFHLILHRLDVADAQEAGTLPVEPSEPPAYQPRLTGAFKWKPEWQEKKCMCPRCGKYDTALLEHGETELRHECVHCDNNFIVTTEE